VNTPKRLLVALILATVSWPAAAAGLSKYKDWALSPEAYFLSQDERAKWGNVSTDQEAEKFIEHYKSSRGAGFAAAIQSRIDYADKNFKLGKRRGSETLRGKTLIVLGPPSRVESTGTGGSKGKTDTTGGDLIAAGGGDSKGGGNVGNMHSNAGGPGANSLRSMSAQARVVSNDWVYDSNSVPAALKVNELTLQFRVFPDESREEAVDPQKLEQMMATVVEYWKPKS
jgi:GWxTD domain-containing protein